MIRFYNECKNCGWFEESDRRTLDYEPELAIIDTCPECGSDEVENDEYDDGEIEEYKRGSNYRDYDYPDYGPDYGSPSY